MFSSRKCAVFGIAVLCVGGCRRTPEVSVATVGNETISSQEFATHLRETPTEFQQYVASAEGRRQLLDILVREKVVLNAAEKSGIRRQPAYREAVERYAQGLKKAQTNYENALLVRSYMQRLRMTELAVTDMEVQRYYDAHRDLFEHPIEIQASHILVSTQQQAEAVIRQLQGGEPFDTIARKYSQDPTTAARGGAMAPFVKGLGNGQAQVEAKASEMTVWETSKPIQTAFGFHIIRKTGERKLAPRSYNDVKEEIRTRLEKQKFDQWVGVKQATLGVHINESALASSATPTANPEEPVKNEHP